MSTCPPGQVNLSSVFLTVIVEIREVRLIPGLVMILLAGQVRWGLRALLVNFSWWMF